MHEILIFCIAESDNNTILYRHMHAVITEGVNRKQALLLQIILYIEELEVSIKMPIYHSLSYGVGKLMLGRSLVVVVYPLGICILFVVAKETLP